jgi:hypothetical protein
MIRFACPGCGVVYSVADEKAGKTGKCPKCQSNFVIPNADPSAPPPLPGASPEPEPAFVAADDIPPPVEDPTAPVEVAPCPGCQVRLSVEPKDVGLEVECPYCKTLFTAKRLQPRPSSAGAGGRRAAEDRPSRRPRRDEDEEARPSRRRWDSDDEDDYSPRRRREKRPSEISTIAGMLLGGGIWGLACVLGVGGLSSGLWCCTPGPYYALVISILLIVRGANMLGNNDVSGPPRTLQILQIIMIINLDVPNLVMGIIGLVLLGNEKVKDYYERRGFDM